MGSRLGRFDYKILGGRKAEYPTNAAVQIRLAHWTESEGGQVFISPHLMTAGEIDFQVDLLKKDLDAVARNAKVALRKASSE